MVVYCSVQDILFGTGLVLDIITMDIITLVITMVTVSSVGTLLTWALLRHAAPGSLYCCSLSVSVHFLQFADGYHQPSK